MRLCGRGKGGGRKARKKAVKREEEGGQWMDGLCYHSAKRQNGTREGTGSGHAGSAGEGWRLCEEGSGGEVGIGGSLLKGIQGGTEKGVGSAYGVWRGQCRGCGGAGCWGPELVRRQGKARHAPCARDRAVKEHAAKGGGGRSSDWAVHVRGGVCAGRGGEGR